MHLNETLEKVRNVLHASMFIFSQQPVTRTQTRQPMGCVESQETHISRLADWEAKQHAKWSSQLMGSRVVSAVRIARILQSANAHRIMILTGRETRKDWYGIVPSMCIQMCTDIDTRAFKECIRINQEYATNCGKRDTTYRPYGSTLTLNSAAMAPVNNAYIVILDCVSSDILKDCVDWRHAQPRNVLIHVTLRADDLSTFTLTDKFWVAAEKAGRWEPGERMVCAPQLLPAMERAQTSRDVAKAAVAADKHKKRQKHLAFIAQRPQRLERCTIRAYHCTTRKAANVIMSTQRFRRGTNGMVGGGIYFAETPEDARRKARPSDANVVLDAKVQLGRQYVVSTKGDKTLSYARLVKMERDSVLLNRTNGLEYVVYKHDQVSDICIL
jgi:hypothetical protein